MNTTDKVIKKVNSGVNYIIYILLAVLLLFGGYSIWDMFLVYDGTRLDNEILKYRPDDTEELSLSELQKINPDIKAWIRVDNTKIDYPIVQGKDNFEYLNLDYKRSFSLAGSIFLDYRNNPDFTDKHNILYGHNINGNLMFADVRAYRFKWFFDQNKTGHLFTPKTSYKLDIFAYLEVDSYDKNIYNVSYSRKKLSPSVIADIKKKAKLYREVELNENDQIVMLSTCLSDSAIRSIAVAKMIK